jgi:hypothetical protein
MTSEKSTDAKKLWVFPWKYRESFIIALGLLIIGFTLEFITGGRGIGIMSFPVNIIVLLVFTNVLVLLHIFLKPNPFVRWLSSVPAAITSLSLTTFLALLLGFTLQDDAAASFILKNSGISHMTSSYTFILAQFFLLTSLGLVALRRSFPFTKKNIGFMLNHVGLWIVLAAAGFGSGDMKRLNMNLDEGKDAVNIAYDQKNQPYRLRLSIKLLNFNIEEYPSKIGLVDLKTGNFVFEKGQPLPEAVKGAEYTLKNWKVKIEDYLPLASFNDSTYEFSDQIGAAPLVVVSIQSITENSPPIKGFLSSGSFLYPNKFLNINSEFALALSQPDPKKFSSEIEYLTMDGGHDSTTIEVNKPHKIGGWKVYQMGYDTEMGRWSKSSILELVNDPWLPFVYFGIFLMLAGACYIFWVGKDFK